MHELGITRSVVAIVAERAQGRQVLRVTLEVGKLAGLMPEAIRFCFDICSQGTPVQGAALHIVEPEGRGRCEACGAEPVLHMPLGRCPVCGAPALRVVSGNELKIKDMETASCV